MSLSNVYTFTAITLLYVQHTLLYCKILLWNKFNVSRNWVIIGTLGRTSYSKRLLLRGRVWQIGCRLHFCWALCQTLWPLPPYSTPYPPPSIPATSIKSSDTPTPNHPRPPSHFVISLISPTFFPRIRSTQLKGTDYFSDYSVMYTCRYCTRHWPFLDDFFT